MKIIHQKYKCIGCRACANVCPRFFKMGRDGKATLKKEGVDLEKDDGKEEILSIEEPDCAREAVEVCPVQCIRIEK